MWLTPMTVAVMVLVNRATKVEKEHDRLKLATRRVHGKSMEKVVMQVDLGLATKGNSVLDL